MTAPGATQAEPDSGYQRLEQQIGWYDTKSGSAQRWYKGVKFVEFVLGAAIPLTANYHGPTTAVLGIVVIVLEGLQQMNQWQHNWITYRSTCESLRHEKYSYLSRSGVYDELDDGRALKTLVERVEGLVSTEHSKWLSQQQYEVDRIKRRSPSSSPVGE